MKKSEKLLDIIGQIDDRLVEEASHAGREPARRKGSKLYRFRGALAACAVLAICVGVWGILVQTGTILNPFGGYSASAPESAMEMEEAGEAAGEVLDAAAPELAAAKAEDTPEDAAGIDAAGTDTAKAALTGQADSGVPEAQSADDGIAGQSLDESAGLQADGAASTAQVTDNSEGRQETAKASGRSVQEEETITFTGTIVENTIDSVAAVILVKPDGEELPYEYVFFELPDEEADWAKKIGARVEITCGAAFEESEPPYGMLISIEEAD